MPVAAREKAFQFAQARRIGDITRKSTAASRLIVTGFSMHPYNQKVLALTC
jgi:hypothetical protein